MVVDWGWTPSLHGLFMACNWGVALTTYLDLRLFDADFENVSKHILNQMVVY